MAGALILAGLAAAAPAGAVSTPKTVLVYGDSLTWESFPDMQTFAAPHIRSITLENGSLFATAPCVWSQELPAAITQYHPAVVTIETVANPYNSLAPCEVDSSGNPLVPGSAGFYANYQANLATMLADATAAGAKVVLFEGPPIEDSSWNADVTGVIAIEQRLATQYPGVVIDATPRLEVSKNGAYEAYKHCLTFETATDGCVGRQIPIRTIAGPQTGIHFCPGGLEATWPGLCPTYSSGEYRWAKATVAASLAALR